MRGIQHADDKGILADEPTGALDSKSGETVLDILKELHAAGHTIIVVTHDMDIARHANRIVEIKDGAIIADQRGSVEAIGLPGKLGKFLILAGLWGGFFQRLMEALPMALHSIAAHIPARH